MACLDNIQIIQTVTYSSTPNDVLGFLLGQINVQILNAGSSTINGTITVDKVRDLLADITEGSISQVDNISSDNETFVYNFYYPTSNPESITINATINVQIDDCLYTSSCNHVLLTPNDAENESNCISDVLGYEAVSGCTNPLYYEYNPKANVDDGSCLTLKPILGCTNPYATNYNPLATFNDGSCVFPSGCTNPLANNYDSTAIVDDGSCKCGDINVQLDFFGNSGTSLALEESCDYFVDFDLFVKIDCGKFIEYFENDTRTILDILNSLKFNFQVHTLLDDNGNNYPYTGGTIEISGSPIFALTQNENIYSFDINNTPVGIGVKSNDESCETLYDLIATELGLECQSFDKTKFDVTWKSYRVGINSDLVNTFSRLSINLEGFRFGICVYLDNVKISKVCTENFDRCVTIPSVYGFELEKIIDNKKSWTVTNTSVLRKYYDLPNRETEYLDYDSRLIFNTKELELQINPMKYIQKDVIDYYNNYQNFYGDIDSRLKDMTIQKIESQFIDVRNRQVIRKYSYLPIVYEQYLDGLSCAPSKALHYGYGLDIIEKSGDVWYNLVKQVIPMTTIWDERQYVLKNSVFDLSKHKYKKYTLDKGNGGNTDNCASSGVTVECQTISDKCFDSPFTSIDELLVSGISEIICVQTGDTACFSEYTGDGSFSGRIIHYVGSSGNTIDVLNLVGYQNYNCYMVEDLNVDVTYICSGIVAQLVVNIQGGTQPYTIIGNQNGQILPINTLYLLKVVDSEGVESELQTGVLVCPPPPNDVCDNKNVIVSASYTCTTNDCNDNTSEATLNLSAIGGLAPYIYVDLISASQVYDGGIVVDGQNLNIIAYDADGCISNNNVLLNVSCPSCPMQNGNMELTVNVRNLNQYPDTVPSFDSYALDYFLNFLNGQTLTCISIYDINNDVSELPIICSNLDTLVGFALTLPEGTMDNEYTFVFKIIIELSSGCKYNSFISLTVPPIEEGFDTITVNPTLYCETNTIEVLANYECNTNSCGYFDGTGILYLDAVGGTPPYMFYDLVTNTQVNSGDIVIDGQQLNIVAYDSEGYLSDNIVQLSIDCEESPCNEISEGVSLSTTINYTGLILGIRSYDLKYTLTLPLGSTLSNIKYEEVPLTGLIILGLPFNSSNISDNIVLNVSGITPNPFIFNLRATITLNDGCEYIIPITLEVSDGGIDSDISKPICI